VLSVASALLEVKTGSVQFPPDAGTVVVVTGSVVVVLAGAVVVVGAIVVGTVGVVLRLCALPLTLSTIWAIVFCLAFCWSCTAYDLVAADPFAGKSATRSISAWHLTRFSNCPSILGRTDHVHQPEASATAARMGTRPPAAVTTVLAERMTAACGVDASAIAERPGTAPAATMRAIRVTILRNIRLLSGAPWRGRHFVSDRDAYRS
jgi:hypothetical protein